MRWFLIFFVLSGVRVSPNHIMVLDFFARPFPKISIYFAFIVGLSCSQCLHLIAQPLTSASNNKDSLSSTIVFLKHNPAPRIIQVETVARVKAKAPVRDFSVYGIEDGLALQTVFSGFKDHDGNLWFATSGAGVSKFDGSTFTNFDERHGLGNGVVRAIAQDNRGNYYFGTRTGLSVYNGATIKNYYVNEGFPPRPIACLIVSATGGVWIGTQGGGLVKFDGANFTTYTVADGLVSNTVRSLEIDNQGLLWIGTQEGIMTFDGYEFKIFKTPDRHDKTVYDIHQDTNGTLWFACAEEILKLHGDNLQHFSMKDGVSDSRVLSIGEDKNGVIWFGTLEGGVTRLDGNSFEAITIADGLPSNRIWGSVTDAAGNIWFCTQGGGIARYNGNSLVSFTTQQGLAHNLVWSMAQDRKGRMWFGHDIGLSSFDGEYFTTITSGDSLFHFFAIEVDSKGNIWGGGRHGIFRWDGKNLTQYARPQGLASDQISDIVIDKSDVIWVGTEDGLTRFDGNTFTNFAIKSNDVDRRLARVFIDRDQTVWACFTNKIFRYDGSRFERVTWPGMPKDFTVTAVVQDKAGYYWMASRAGLVRYDGKSCLHFTYDNGLPNDHIFDMKLDPATQDLWLGTNLGLINLSFRDRANTEVPAGSLTVGNEVLKTLEPVWSEYNRNTGYPLDDLNHPALHISTKGFESDPASGKSLIWGGFADKLFRFDPSDARPALVTPKLSISNLKLDGRIVSWHSLASREAADDSLLSAQEKLILGKSLTVSMRRSLREKYKGARFDNIERFSGLPGGLVLPHTFDKITFDFGAIETSQGALINYQYRLRGQDEAWSYPAKERSATFTNPWEGNYTFEVRAQSSDGAWTKPVVFSFSVLPPWWRSWPMYGAYAVTFAFLLFGFVKIRESKLQSEKQILESIITERTTEVMKQMRSAEMQKLEAQKQKCEADHQRALVEEKNAEIAKQLTDAEACLSNLTLQMIQRFHAYTELELELRKLAEVSDAKKFQKIFSFITMNKSLDKEWEQFNFYFNGLYKDFNRKLQELSTQLSNYDLRMCALIKMGLETREIAMLLNIEASSVKMAKYRLKKKLNIDESVSLRSWFETL
jgi:ligand-binding sensor domain-containing protein/DNA-binding CsgD family transcriptional regulator